MRSVRSRRFLVTAGVLGLLVSVAPADKPAPFPDLTQTDPKGEFARGGKSYCGPVAVSNSLMFLFHEDLKWEDVSHYDLVNRLASLPYMNTHEVNGTSANQLMRGVQRFLREREVKGYYLKFQGWRKHASEYRTWVPTPRLTWIKQTLAGGGAVWLNLGWYKEEPEDDAYRRIGGHWVTAVGYGKDEAGKADPNMVIIHDPAPRAGLKPAREYVKMTLLKDGRLVGSTSNLPHPARGLYKMEGGMHVKSTADLAILDGAVSLRLKKREQVEGE